MPVNLSMDGSVQHAVTRRSIRCCTTWGSQHLKGWKTNYAILFFIPLLGPGVGKKCKQDQNCDLVVLKSTGIAKFEMFAHLQEAQVFSAQPASKQAIC